MAKTSDTPGNVTKDMQTQYFCITDNIPEEVWYWAALGSILASAILFVANKRDWGIFVGQWPPTFLLFGIFHKVRHRSQF